jgi:hypothetical protein
MTSKMLRRFVETTKVPYCTTQMGKGVIDTREANISSGCDAIVVPPSRGRPPALHTSCWQMRCCAVQVARVSWEQVGDLSLTQSVFSLMVGTPPET